MAVNDDNAPKAPLPEIETEDSRSDAEGDLHRSEGVDSAGTGAAAQTRRHPLFPGLVIFFVFIVAVIGAFMIWRLQQRATLDGSSDGPTTRAQVSSTRPAEPLAEDASTATPPITGAISHTPSHAAKIQNNIDDVKDTASAFSYDTGDSVDKSAGPPSPSSAANNTLMQKPNQEASEQSGDAQVHDESPYAFEVGREPFDQSAQSSAGGQLSDDDLQASPRTAGVQLENPPLHGANNAEDLRNDLAELKSSLEDERKISQEQAEELSNLKAAVIERNSEASLHSIPGFDPSKIGNLPVQDPVKLSLALLSLNRALNSGKPYQAELERVERLTSPQAVELTALRAHAAEGVPSVSLLEASFPQAAREALAASAREKARGPVGAIVARLSSLVSVRPAAPQSGNGTAAVISRAEARLGSDDLQRAVEELDGLTGEAREAFVPWITIARARLNASQEAALLERALAAREP
jgi:hypothetical protein